MNISAWVWLRRWAWWLPTGLTLWGAALGTAALLWLPADPLIALPLWAAGCLCDVLDGHTARALGMCTPLGRRLDHSIDVALAACAWSTVHPALACMGAVASACTNERVSLRAAFLLSLTWRCALF